MRNAWLGLHWILVSVLGLRTMATLDGHNLYECHKLECKFTELHRRPVANSWKCSVTLCVCRYLMKRTINKYYNFGAYDQWFGQHWWMPIQFNSIDFNWFRRVIEWFNHEQWCGLLSNTTQQTYMYIMIRTCHGQC